MNTGPKATSGFDLALTEVVEAPNHFFVTEIATERGLEIMRDVRRQEPTEDELHKAEQTVAHAAGQMGRHMDTSDIKDLLYRNYENPRWDDVAG
jgi:hypothetical protein